MAPKKITNEVLDIKLDTMKDKLSEHIAEEVGVFNNIYKMVERIDARTDNIDVTLAKQHIVLKDHIRRTEALEATIVPIKAKSDVATLVLKIAASIGAAGAGGFGIKELILLLAS